MTKHWTQYLDTPLNEAERIILAAIEAGHVGSIADAAAAANISGSYAGNVLGRLQARGLIKKWWVLIRPTVNDKEEEDV